MPIAVLLFANLGASVAGRDEPDPRPLAATVWVDQTARSCDGNVPCVPSIQIAIDIVDVGGTVLVLGDQTYLETLDVWHSVHIFGESRSNVTVDGQFGASAFSVIAGPVTIENMTIRNAQYGVAVQASSVAVRNVLITGTLVGVQMFPTTFGVTLQNVEIQNALGVALFAAQATNLLLDGVTVLGGMRGIAVQSSVGATIRNSSVRQPGGIGILFAGTTDPTIGPNNTVSDGQDRGMSVNGSSGVVLRGNVLRNNALLGLNVSESVGVTVEGNVIEGNGVSGIFPRGGGPGPLQGGGGGLRFWQTDPVLVTNNRVEGNHGFGIQIHGNRSTDYVLAGNTVAGNNGTGLVLTGGAARIDVAGAFANNAGDGIAMDNVSAVSIHDAQIEGNADLGVRGQYAVNVSVLDSDIRFNGLGFAPRSPGSTPSQGGGGGLRFWQTDPSEIRNTTIRDNAGVGVALVDTTDFAVVSNTIANQTGNGLVLDRTARTTVAGNRVTNASVAVEVLGGDASLSRNFLANATIGVSLSAGAFVAASNDTFEGTTSEYSLDGTSRAIALNETFGGRTFLLVDDRSNLTVRWFLDVDVLDADGNPAGEATVRVLDLAGTEVFNGTADAQGETRWIVLTQADVTRSGTYPHTPHEAQAYRTGPDLGSSTVTMTSSQAVVVRLFRDDTAPTVGSAFADPTPQEQFLAVNVSTTVQDVSPVAVYLNVTYPDGTWRNETMTNGAGDGYYLSRAYGQLGGHAILITAIDSWGNVALRTGAFMIILPNEAPAITNVAAVPDPQEAGGVVNVSATVTDGDGVASVSILFTYPSGSSIFRVMSPLPGNVWYYPDTYTELGVYRFTITARDGNATIPKASTANGTFVVRDTTPPTADAGPDQIVTQGTLVTFQGDGSSDNLGILNYTWTFDDQGPRALFGVSPTYVFARIGGFLVTLTVMDLVGNTDTDAMTVTVLDVTPPQIIGLAANPSPAESPGATNVSFAVVELNLVSVARIAAFDPGNVLVGNLSSGYDSGTGRYFLIWTLTQLGAYRFVAYAEDQSGNFDVFTRMALAQDTIPPAFTAADAVPATQQVLSPILLWAQASDAFLASLSVEVRDPLGAFAATVTMTYNGTTLRHEAWFVPVALGTYTFRVWALDTTENVASRAGSFVSQDAVAPTLAALAVSPQPAEIGGTVDVAVNATDDFSLNRVWIQLTDPTGTPFAPFDLVSLTGDRYHDMRVYLQLGTYTLTIWAEDSSGNRASLPGQVVVADLTPPTMGPLMKDPPSGEVGASINVSAAVSDNVGLQRVSLQVIDPSDLEVGNHTMTCAAGVCYFSRAYGVSGMYRLRIWATDTTGNMNMREDTLTMVPGLPPVARAGADVTIDAGGIVAFDGNASTDDFGIVRHTWTFTYGGRTVTLSGAREQFRFDTAGTYVVTLTVEDARGQTDTDTLVVTVREPGGVSPILWALLFLAILLALGVGAWGLLRRRRAAKSRDAEPTEEGAAPRTEGGAEPKRRTMTDEELEQALRNLEDEL